MEVSYIVAEKLAQFPLTALKALFEGAQKELVHRHRDIEEVDANALMDALLPHIVSSSFPCSLTSIDTKYYRAR